MNGQTPTQSAVLLVRESEAPGDLHALWSALSANAIIICAVTLTALLAAGLSFFAALPPTYSASTTLAPLAESTVADSAAAQWSSELSFLLDLPEAEKNRDILIFLNSRLLRQRLIETYDLLPILYADDWDEQRRDWTSKPPTVVRALQEEAVDERLSVHTDKGTDLVEIVWRSEDPGFAAAMVQRVVDELRLYLERDYTDKTRRTREFLEERAAAAAVELAEWDKAAPNERLSAEAILRERTAASAVYVELKKRLALAKIAEAERKPEFKVLDPPLVPEKPQTFERIVYTMVAGGTAFFGTCFAVLVVRLLRRGPACDHVSDAL